MEENKITEPMVLTLDSLKKEIDELKLVIESLKNSMIVITHHVNRNNNRINEIQNPNLKVN